MIEHLPLFIEDLKRELEQSERALDIKTLASICSQRNVSGHLAVFTKPYLEKVIAGQKTIESRFSKMRIPPFGRVRVGDIIFLKEVAGPIRGVAIASQVQFFGPLKVGEAGQLIESYQDGLQIDNAFKNSKHDSLYATLIFLEPVLSLNPFRILKVDRRSWIPLAEREQKSDLFPTQLCLFIESQECEEGLHSYHNSRRSNAKGHPICKYCGSDTIDWDRVHRRDLTDVDYTILQLHTEKFRYEWWSKQIDPSAKNHALRKGLINLRAAVFSRLKKSVGEVYEMPDGSKSPYRDGRQTPYNGNSIYYAQHALACCCRKCMKYWYGVPLGCNLSESELLYFTELVMLYVKTRLPEIQQYGQDIPKHKRVLKLQGGSG